MKSFRCLLVTLPQICKGLTSQRTRLSSSLMAVKFRGRYIPHVETLQEHQRRTLWESNPFSTANSVIDTFLESKDLILLQVLDHPISSYPSSGYEDLFKPLYESSTNDEDFGEKDAVTTRRKQSPDKLRHFKLQVAYRGTAFCGWQTQTHNYVQPSIQQTLEENLALLHGSRVNLRVCGRTDAGVHAIGQVCRFRTNLPLTVDDIMKHFLSLPNQDVAVTRVTRVARSFHPTFNANCRAYSYVIDMKNDFMLELDLDLLNSMLQSLEGKILDYSGLSYGKLKTQTPDCILYHARARSVQSISTKTKALCIELVGNRFLRRMVRLLVGTVLDLALHKSSPDALLNHVQAQSKNSKLTAPAEGLLFVGARFDTT